MKNFLLFTAFSLFLVSCGNSTKTESIDTLISAKNTKALQAKKVALQADITKIEAALATLEVKTEEALVAVATVKDTIFNHYLKNTQLSSS